MIHHLFKSSLSRIGDRLPAELVNQIICSTADDVTTLKACTLVSHTWKGIARSHMFRKVAIVTEGQLLALENLLRSAPELDAYVRELSIGPFSASQSGLRNGTHEGCRWVTRLPENLPRLLTKVRTIHFIRLSDAGEYCDAEFFAMFYYFVTVTKLVLEDCAINTSVLKAFASSLPALADLHITDLLPLMVTVWEAPPQLLCPRISSLVLDFTKTPSQAMNNLVSWILSSQSRATLRSVDFGFTILDAKVINRCLSEIGPALEHLGLRLKNMFEASEWEHELIQKEVDVGVCTNLHSLTIDFATTGATLAFLRDVRANDLRTLSFHVYMKDTASPPDYESLSHTLMNPRFSTLQKVQFIQQASLPLASVEEAVMKALPDLYARGLVSVVCGRAL